MAEKTLTRAEEDALARAHRAVGAGPDRRSTARRAAPRKRPGQRGARSVTLDLARGLVLTIAVTLLLAGDPSRLPPALRPVGGDGFGVVDLLPVSLTVLVGVSMAWQLASHRHASPAWWWLRWARRVGVLVGVGVLLAWLRMPDPESFRLTGPLVRLAVGGVITWFVVTRLSPRVQTAVGTGLVVTHWLLLSRGVLGAGGPVARLEAAVLDGRAALPVDPDGLTALGPTVVAMLAGVWIGRWLRERPPGLATVLAFALAGAYAAAAGLGLAHLLPVNAVLWTGSTMLLGVGVVLLVVALAHLAAEVLPTGRALRWVEAVGAEALPVYGLAVGLTALSEAPPLGSARTALRTALVEPLVGPHLAPIATAALGTLVLARVAVALVDRGRLLRA